MEKIWLNQAQDKDFVAAEDYLDLFLTADERKRYIDQLRATSVTSKKAADILRAAGLPLLDKKDPDVRQDIKQFKKKKKLSPVLLIRLHDKLVIADGYHRICAAYYLTEDLEVPCLLA